MRESAEYYRKNNQLFDNSKLTYTRSDLVKLRNLLFSIEHKRAVFSKNLFLYSKPNSFNYAESHFLFIYYNCMQFNSSMIDTLTVCIDTEDAKTEEFSYMLNVCVCNSFNQFVEYYNNLENNLRENNRTRAWKKYFLQTVLDCKKFVELRNSLYKSGDSHE